MIASNFYFINLYINNKPIERETVFVSRVIDGDTLELKDKRVIRLANINSPEKDFPGYGKAKEFLQSYENLTVDIEILGTDQYNRLLVRLFYNEDYINLESVKLGFSSKFLVEESEKETFANAEKFAISNFFGVWKKSEFFGCLSSKMNEVEEFVRLTNHCNSINVRDWILKDESRKIYKFNDMYLGEIIINSWEGRDNSTDVFWNFKNDVWNNDRDTLYLFDENGNIVLQKDYGY